MRFGARLKHAWNIFSNQTDPIQRRQPYSEYYGAASGSRPDRMRLRIPNERSIISAIYTRLSIDIASVDMRHCRIDDEERYVEDIDSGLQNCLQLEANIDQGAADFRQDLALTLFDRGCAAIVPVDTSVNPSDTSGGYDILTLRVGEIVQWYPKHVRVNLYNEARGLREEITLHKRSVAIVYNPLYSVMNEPNSTLQRLLHKLNLLDVVDDQVASGKLDLIIQLPYVIKSEARRQQAEQRRADIEFQLKGSKYGIAYTDGTERITQLNRPAENNLLAQVEYLTKFLYAQLGLTDEVMNGTADEKAMLNYWNRTIEPILTATVEGMRRSFLTKTARTQKQTILFFKDPFKLIPIEQLAEIADKFTRNEIATANEIRQVVGWKPHKDPKANQLINSNMPQQTPSDSIVPATDAGPTGSNPVMDEMSSSFDQIDAAINEALNSVSSTNGASANATS